MKQGRLNDSVAALGGLLFALGLGIGGMTKPEKVIGFLDVFGRWDPTLLFVMGGAILFHAPLALVMRRRNGKPQGCDVAETKPASVFPLRDIKLIGGAAVFGVGWAFLGFCPGPALVALGSGLPSAAVFTLGMMLAISLHSHLRGGSKASE